ncbi:MAG TPA: D-alanine--D-alanine ligase family protein [Candidatus Limnocylindrales bacterium]|nr:D-alanine--D-alanine ligase family protein [Candidatus Limnocylindrales bacterium]
MTDVARPHRPPLPDAPVAVLFGGPSAEHDVSIVSGEAIADALDDAGVAVSRVLVDLDGSWWWLPPGHRRGDRPPAAYDDPAALGADGPLSVGAALDRLAATTPPPIAFLAFHGPWGEDGTVQALVESIGLPYTGAGVLASALGMDKAIFKRLCRGLGLPVVDWREIGAGRWVRDPAAVLVELEAFAQATGDERLMIKPARLGSSVGMTLAHTPAERAPALERAFAFDTLVLVERYVAEARELEVAVIGNDPAAIELYGPGEILSGHEFYDYEAKYSPGLSETRPAAELPPILREQIRKHARDAYRAIGAEGFGRVDFLLGRDAVYISEINTIPGFTPISLFPTLPAESGLDFAAVCLRVLELAVERQAARSRRRLRPAELPR